jgi:peroxiredoxin
MVLVLSRGGYCLKDRRQAEGLVQLHRELEVAYCRLVTISTDNITETNEYRSGVGAHWSFLSDPGRTVQKDLDIALYTDPAHNPAHNPTIPHVIVLEPGLVIYKIYRTCVLLRKNAAPTGISQVTRTQSRMGTGPQGSLLSVRQNVPPNSW